MLRRVLVLLASACLLVEPAIVKKRQNEGCQRLSQCTAALENYVLGHDGVSAYLSVSSEEVLNNVCELKSEVDQCVDDARNECDSQNVLAEVEETVAVPQYLCSDRGRQAIQALVSTECVTNQVSLQQYRVAKHSCAVTFRFDVATLARQAQVENRDFNLTEMCPLVESWAVCTFAAADRYCGTEFAEFIYGIIETLSRSQLGHLGCLNVVNTKRQFFGRAMDVLKRWPTKRALSNTIELIAARAIPGLL